MKEIPTMNFLEEYAMIVLQKNIESLYACGGGDFYECHFNLISLFWQYHLDLSFFALRTIITVVLVKWYTVC